MQDDGHGRSGCERAEVKLAAALALLALCAAVYAAEAVLNEDERLLCRLGGGCLFITQDALVKQLRAAKDAGKREAEESCRRPMT